MIRGLVESMLGAVGRSVLVFYEAHVVILSLVIIAYGVLMFLAWMNLVRIYRYLVVFAAAEIDPERKPTPGGAKRTAKLPTLPWQAAVDSVRFPLVSRRAGLLPMRKRVPAVQSIIDEHELLQHALAVADGADPRRISPAYRLADPKAINKHRKT